LRRIAGLTALLALIVASPAAAQVDLFSRDTFSGVADLRLTAANGEKSWIRKNGFGKTRASGGGDEFAIRPSLAEADLVWRPSLSWNLGATVVGQYQPDQIKPLGVAEAFLTWKPLPKGPFRQQVRAGLFYPAISQEHTAGAWLVADSITPSAINTWVGEEIKVTGAEYSFTRAFENGQEIGGTLGAFQENDTSGTLLSMRGWALHDLKSTAGGDFPLAALSAFMRNKQAPITTPVLELDKRVGFYARADWRPAGNVQLNAFYYDNVGDKISMVGSVPQDKQWSWDTRFWNLGASVKLSERMRLKSQAVKGVTLMGFGSPKVWIDVDYQSAYLLLQRSYGDHALTTRFDYFEITDNSNKAVDNQAEHGMALMTAWRQNLSPRVQWLIEAQQVWSTRSDRIRFRIDPSQAQTVLSSALRLSF
jgi:hypothetical protein